MRIFFPFMLSFLIWISFGFGQSAEKEHLNQIIDNWHHAAANGGQQAYFNFMSDDAIYIGTDATENWTKDEFFEWSKLHFESGKTWDFTAIERNLYLSEDKSFAWFDEQLKYSGGTLRGSGILATEKNSWKLKHYVLSLPVPNDKFKEVVKIIKDEEE